MPDIVGLALVGGLCVVAVWRGLRLLRAVRPGGALLTPAQAIELHGRLLDAIRAAGEHVGAPVDAADGVAFFRMSTGLLVGVTRDDLDEGRHELHLSISLGGRPASDAQCSHIACLAWSAQVTPPVDLVAFRTPTGVHHFVMLFESADVRLLDSAESYHRYRAAYAPMRFQPVDRIP